MCFYALGESSRSHGVGIIRVGQPSFPGAQEGTLFLIDLAGSERAAGGWELTTTTITRILRINPVPPPLNSLHVPPPPLPPPDSKGHDKARMAETKVRFVAVTVHDLVDTRIESTLMK